MSQIKVVFEYYTGVKKNLFRHVRLMGSWNPDGHYSDRWRTVSMKPFQANDGCPAFRAEVFLNKSQVGTEFFWGVLVDVPGRANIWGIMTEDGPLEEAALHRSFKLEKSGSVESYWITHCRRLGANKHYLADSDMPALRFSVWAPHAQKVETVVGAEDCEGYIWNNGRGIGRVFTMTMDDNDIWNTDPAEPDLADFNKWVHQPYMFRITREDGSVAYRTDLYSRHQIGNGGGDPEKTEWSGRFEDLDGTKSCSLVVDPEMVINDFRNLHFMGARDLNELGDYEFWAQEFDPLRPLPNRVEDMVIYEMHIGGLWSGGEGPGTLKDAVGMLDYLVDLGINTIELLPMSEFDGKAGWGYGSSHFFAIKYDVNGRDQFKHFIRSCHQHGIAVIMDVVYNHYTPNGERAEWMYDTQRHDHNMYYYYNGQQDDYPEDKPDGGYSDNYSTGFLPNMTNEMVRKMLISSAVAFAVEFHIDGFRMDLTQALHSFNVRHFDGMPLAEANEAGIRFMREWVRTLRLFKPFIILLAEDHSGWSAITRPQGIGGIGFDASWWAEWYHQLVGEANDDKSKARLLRNSGFGTNDPLRMDMFGCMILGSPRRVVYHSSHDEAGNSQGSARTIEVAVNGMLFDNTRSFAEARSRVVVGLTILAGGTPMFFMGEEVAAREPYRYSDFLDHREDYQALREGCGAGMFRFYQDLIRLRRWVAAFRSPGVEVIYSHDEHRILTFRRWWGDEEYLVVSSLNNQAFAGGYQLNHPSLKGKQWTEVLNSDADIYGGWEVTNPEELPSPDGEFCPKVPACGLTVFVNTA